MKEALSESQAHGIEGNQVEPTFNLIFQSLPDRHRSARSTALAINLTPLSSISISYSFFFLSSTLLTFFFLILRAISFFYYYPSMPWINVLVSVLITLSCAFEASWRNERNTFFDGRNDGNELTKTKKLFFRHSYNFA